MKRRVKLSYLKSTSVSPQDYPSPQACVSIFKPYKINPIDNITCCVHQVIHRKLCRKMKSFMLKCAGRSQGSYSVGTFLISKISFISIKLEVGYHRQ